MGAIHQALLSLGPAAGGGLTTPEVEFDARSLLGADGSTITTPPDWEDISGNNRDGTLFNDPTTVETNELNGHQVSRWNGGTMSWTGNSPSLAFTVIAVLKCTSFASNRTVIAANTGGILQLPVLWLTTAGKLEMTNAGASIGAVSSTALNTTNFYTIAITYDGATGAYAFYLNGSADGSGTATALSFNGFERIGRRNGNQNPFPGDIAYMALWNSVLGGSELTSRFAALRTVWAHY